MDESSPRSSRRRTPLALAAALGTPLIAAAPAAADPGLHGHVGGPQAAGQAAPAAGDAQASQAEAAQASAGAQASPAAATTASAGTHTSHASEDSTAGASGSASAHASAAASSHGSGSASARGGASAAAHGGVTARHASSHARGAWDAPPANATTPAHAEAAAQARTVTPVKVSTHEDEHGTQRASAHVKAGPGFTAAIRAEARHAAREEVRARIASSVGLKMKVAPDTEGLSAHARVRTRSQTGAQAALFMRLIHAAWKSGGAAHVNALLELCFAPGSAPQSPAHELSALLAALEHHAGAGLHGHLAAGLHGDENAQGNAYGHLAAGPHGRSTVNGQGGANGVGEEAGGGAGGVLGGGVAGVQGTAGVAATTAPVTAAGGSPGAAPATSTAPRGGATTPAGGAAAPAGSGVLGESGRLGSGGAAGSRLQSAASVSGRQLPFTGLDLPVVAMLGGAALLAGAVLRRLGQDRY